MVFRKMRQRQFSQGFIFVAFYIFAIFCGISSAFSELRNDITQGTIKPMPVAISDLVGAKSEEKRIGKDISRIISADLERSGLFKAIDKKAFIQKLDAVETLPRFGDWRVINSQALVHGRAQLDGRGCSARISNPAADALLPDAVHL